MLSESIAHEHNNIWAQKASLRALYSYYYRRIAEECVDGVTLEIGSGCGNLNLDNGKVIKLDVQEIDLVDVVGDAEVLPFRNKSIQNIVLVDVLHHLQYPLKFFMEARRVLGAGGRLIMLEPAITPVSKVFYHYLHPEPVDMNVNPFIASVPVSGKNPYDSNQAIPTIIFNKMYDQYQKLFSDLRVRKKLFMSLWCYPLSGGFRPWCLIPSVLVMPLLKIEELLLPKFGDIAAFRLFIVLEKC